MTRGEEVEAHEACGRDYVVATQWDVVRQR